MLKGKTATEIILLVHAKLPDLAMRQRFDEARRGLSISGLKTLCASVLASTHKGTLPWTNASSETMPYELPQKPYERIKIYENAFVATEADIPTREVITSVVEPRTIIPPSSNMAAAARSNAPPSTKMRAIAMPEVLDSMKSVDKGSFGVMTVSQVDFEIPVDDSLCAEFPSDEIGLAVMKHISSIPPPKSSGRQSTILPSPSPNMREVAKIPMKEIPKEERQFRIPTVPEMNRHRTPATATYRQSPAKGSDHSALKLADHNPDSGRYSVIPPREKK